MAYDIGPKIGIDGEAEYRKSIQNINTSMKTLTSELKMVASSFDGTEKSTEALTKKNEVLQKELTAQNTKLSESQKMLDAAKEKYGENSTEVQRWQTVCNNAQTEVNKLNSQISANDKAISANEAGYERLNKVLGISGTSVSELGTIIGKDLADSIANGTASSDELDKALQTMAETSTDSKVDVEKLKGVIDAIEPGAGLDEVEAAFADAGSSASDNAGNVDEFSEKLDQIATTQALEMLQSISEKIAEVGQKAMDAYSQVEEGTDNIVLATGAIGEDADAFANVYKTAANSVVGDLGDIGGALGEINTRFGYVGDVLETATEDFMKFSNVTGTDAVTSVQLVSRMMNEAGLNTHDYKKYLDELAVAGQATGISVSSLAQTVTTNGMAMRELGLSTEESIALLAGFETAGVDTNTALAGMKKAVQKWSKEGKNSGEEFKKMLKGLEDGTVSYADASAVFGGKAATAIMNMAQSGKFSIADMMKTLETSGGTVDATYEEWAGGTQSVELAQQKMTLAWSELGESVMSVFAPAIETAANVVGGIADAFSSLPQPIQTVVGVLGTASIAVPAVTAAFSAVKTIMGPLSGVFAGTGEGMTTMLSTFGPAAGIIGGVAAVLYGCYQNSETFRTACGNLVGGVMASLQTAFETLNPLIDTCKQAFQNVMDALNPFLQSFGDLLGTTIVPMVQSFLEWLIPTVADVLAACQPFITAIGDFLAAILTVGQAVIALIQGDFSGCWDLLTQAASSAFDGVKNVFSGIWNIGSTLVTDLWNGITEGGAWLWETISGWAGDIWQNIKDGIGNIADIGAGIVSGIWEGIQNKWEEFKTNLGNFATGIGDKVKEVLGIHSPSTVFAEMGSYMTQGMAEGLSDDTAVTDQCTVMCEKISIAFQSGLANVKENLRAALGNLITADMFDASPVVTVIENMVAAIQARVQELAGIFDKIFTSLRDNSVNQVQLLYSQASSLYTALAKTTKATIQAMGDNVVALFNAMTQATVSTAQTMQKLIVAAVSMMVDKILSAIRTFTTNFYGAWRSVQTTTVFIVSAMSASIVALIQSMAAQIMSVMNTLPPQFQTIGSTMMSQLKAGIDASKQTVIDTSSELVKKLVNVFIEGLGIHSPSKKMQWIGEMMIAGLLAGLDDKQIMELVANTVDQMQASYDKGDIQIGTMIETLDTKGAEALIDYLNEIDGTEATASAVFPLPGSLADYVVTSVFGNRTPPTAGASSNHGGTDISAAGGTPIYAAGSGTVSLAGSYGGYGNCVIVDHGNGFQTLYGHMSSIATSSGSSVKAGQTIGYVGSTGVSTGDHLHFETRKDGTAVDSYPYLEGAAIAGETLASAIQNALKLKELGTSTDAINAMGSKVVLSSLVGTSGMSAEELAAYSGYSGAVSEDQVTEWIKQACTITGEALSSVPYLLYAAYCESGYNPGSINDWDSNAAAGTPSVGLMQVIQPTFDSFKADGYNNIWDPVSNIAAAIGWMRYKYGSVLECCLPRMGHWYGYAVGTRMVPDDMLAMIHKNEAILPAGQNPYTQSGGQYLEEIVTKVMEATGSSRQSSPIVINVNGNVQDMMSTRLEIKRALREYGITTA